VLREKVFWKLEIPDHDPPPFPTCGWAPLGTLQGQIRRLEEMLEGSHEEVWGSEQARRGPPELLDAWRRTSSCGVEISPATSFAV